MQLPAQCNDLRNAVRCCATTGTVLRCTVLHCATICSASPYYLCVGVLRCAVLWCVALCNAVMHCAALRYDICCAAMRCSTACAVLLWWQWLRWLCYYLRIAASVLRRYLFCPGMPCPAVWYDPCALCCADLPCAALGYYLRCAAVS